MNQASELIPIREPETNALLFKYNPDADEIEIQRRGKKTVVKLAQYRDKPPRTGPGSDFRPPR